MTDKKASPSNNLPVYELNYLAYYEFATTIAHPSHQLDYDTLYFVDRGRLQLNLSNQHILLDDGQCMLLSAHTPHQVQTVPGEAANLLVLGLSINPQYQLQLALQPLLLDDYLRQLLGRILSESKLIFPQKIAHVYETSQRLPQANFFNEMLLSLYVSEFLLLFKRLADQPNDKLTDLLNQFHKMRYTHQQTNDVIRFMEEHLNKNISINEFAAHFFVSSSYLKKIFKEDTGYSIINYFRTLKFEQAKQWIRENHFTLTEIAAHLGFDSIHHFSNSFKRYTGFSPTGYRKSIQSIEEKLDALL